MRTALYFRLAKRAKELERKDIQWPLVVRCPVRCIVAEVGNMTELVQAAIDAPRLELV